MIAVGFAYTLPSGNVLFRLNNSEFGRLRVFLTEDVQPQCRLLWDAEMRLPGSAYLRVFLRISVQTQCPVVEMSRETFTTETPREFTETPRLEIRLIPIIFARSKTEGFSVASAGFIPSS